MLNQKFIKRATKVTSFNLSPADFTSTEYKIEIQTLYSQHMFPSFNPSKALSTITLNGYNGLVQQLKRDSEEQYDKLHNLALKGVGPGEAVLYLLTKNGRLGGGSSGGVDLTNGSKKYEIKAAKWKSTRTKDSVSDFRLGGSIPGMAHVHTDILNLGRKLKIPPSDGESFFKKIKEQAPEEYDAIEKQYQKLAGGYFGNHETIFIQHQKTQPDYGEIIAIKKVKPSDVLMERYTGGVIKPIVKIK